MAGNTKISALTTSAAAAGDLIPVDRAGANFAVTPASILSGALGPVNASTRVTSGINAMGNVTGAALAINLALGNVITMTLTGNVTSSSFTNALAAAGQEVTFIITQDGTGGRTFVWPTAVVPAGIAPYPSIALGAVSTFKATIDGSGNANFSLNGPVVVFRKQLTNITSSDATHKIDYVPPIIGNYRLATVLSVTTLSSAATGTTATAMNNGNAGLTSASATATGIFATVSATSTARVYSTSGNTCAMGFNVTLGGTIGTSVWENDFTVEYLGN